MGHTHPPLHQGPWLCPSRASPKHYLPVKSWVQSAFSCYKALQKTVKRWELKSYSRTWSIGHSRQPPVTLTVALKTLSLTRKSTHMELIVNNYTCFLHCRPKCIGRFQWVLMFVAHSGCLARKMNFRWSCLLYGKKPSSFHPQATI